MAGKARDLGKNGLMGCGWTLQLLADRLPCSITEENHATAKAAFIQKLELQSNIVWEGLFAASHYDRYEEQMTLIDQS